VHAIEAFIARVATPLARGLALEAARCIGRSLEVVCREPGNTAAQLLFAYPLTRLYNPTPVCDGNSFGATDRI
jgi:alcohol dehydrogenase class IV